MKKIFYFALVSLIFIQCEKNDPIDTSDNNLNDSLNLGDTNEIVETILYQDFIVAGDLNKITIYNLEESINFLNDGDSIPDLLAGSSSGYVDIPLDIDEDDELDIRYGAHDFLTYNILINRDLFVSNNYGNEQDYQFAIIKPDTLGMDNDTIRFAYLFNEGDTISSSANWYSTKDPSNISNICFISYYYDYDFHNSTIHPNDSGSIDGKELYKNKSGLNKYIGIRKKVLDDYIYGYIQINFENYDDLDIIKSGFADR